MTNQQTTKPIKKYNLQTIGSYCYRESDLLGSGYQSKVYKAVHVSRKYQVALKIIEIDKISAGIQKKLLDSQLRCLQALKGTPHIINLHEVVKTQNYLFVVTQLCKGDISVHHNKKISQIQAWNCIKQVIKGYKSIHAKSFLHRDIKPQNLFLKYQGHIKIGDFGFTTTYEEARQQTHYSIGSPSYMAPQVLHKNDYSYAADIWSIGISYLELCTGKLPWKGTTRSQILSQITSQSIQKLISKAQLKEQSKIFLRRLLAYDPYARIKPQQLFQYKLFETELSRPKSMVQTLSERKIFIPRVQTPKNNKVNIVNYPFPTQRKNYKESDYFIDSIFNKNDKNNVQKNLKRMSFDEYGLKNVKTQQNIATEQKANQNNTKQNGQSISFKKKYRASVDITNQNKIQKATSNQNYRLIQKLINNSIHLNNLILKFLQDSQNINYSTKQIMTQLHIFRTYSKNYLIKTTQKLSNLPQNEILEGVVPKSQVIDFLKSVHYNKVLRNLTDLNKKLSENQQINKHIIRAKQQKAKGISNAGLSALRIVKNIVKNQEDLKKVFIIDSICILTQIFIRLAQDSTVANVLIQEAIRLKKRFSDGQKIMQCIQRLLKLDFK